MLIHEQLLVGHHVHHEWRIRVTSSGIVLLSLKHDYIKLHWTSEWICSDSFTESGKLKKMFFIFCKIETHIFMNVIILICFVNLTVLVYVHFMLLCF